MSSNNFPVEVFDLRTVLPEGAGNLRILDSERLHGKEFVRFFFLDGFESGQVRGDHAHRECWQLIFVLGGKVECEFQTTKGAELKLVAQFPTAILVPPMIWVRLKFSSQDSSVMVAASHAFDESDYIRSPDEFFV